MGAERDVSARRCESCRPRGFRRIMSLAQKNFLLALNLLAASLAAPLPRAAAAGIPDPECRTRQNTISQSGSSGWRGKGEGGQRKRERERATRPERHNRVNYYE